MHIAICDDNVADRQQMERLLSRESENRKNSTGALSIDTYGNIDSLLRTPMIYDGFFIDLTCSDKTGMDIAIALRSSQISAPIILCSTNLNDSFLETSLENIFYLQKPIKKADLSDMLDNIHIINESAVKPIEIHGENKTYYLKKEDILYLHQEGHKFTVHLINEEIIVVLGYLKDIGHQLACYDCFFLTGTNYIINSKYAQKVTLKYITLTNNENIPIPLLDRSFFKKLLKKQKEDGLV